MKRCPKCGARQGDARMYCVDCGQRLGRRLSAEEEKKADEDLGARIEDLYNRGDPLRVDRFDRVCGGIHLVGLTVLLTVLALYAGNVFPSGKASPETVPLALAGLLSFLVGAVDALCPRVTWALERFRMSFWADGAEDLTPSHFYFVCRRVSMVAFALLGALILAFLLYGLLWAPDPAPEAAELFEQLTAAAAG